MSRPSAPEERRQQILEATCTVIAERGFRDVRIADVARVAGFSTGTVHYYFDSKDDLLEEAFRFQYERSVTRRGKALAAHDPVVRLRSVAEAYLPITAESTTSWRVWLELWVSALGNPSLAAVNDTYYGLWRGEVLEAATDAAARGLLRIPDVEAFADAFVGMLDGLAIQVLVRSQHLTTDRMRTALNAFLDGYLPTRA